VAAALREAAGLPVVLTQHQTFHAILGRLAGNGSPAGMPASSMPELQRREERCMAVADAVICVSEVIAAELRAAYPALPPLRVIPNGVDVGRFAGVDPGQVASARAALAGPAETLVLFVGRSTGVKGLPELLMAAALARGEHPGLRFGFILADAAPSAMAGLRSLEMLAGYCTFLGNVARPAIPAYFAAADVVAMPSRWEPFGLVAVEAMAAGAPVIVSDVPPLNRIVVDGVTGRIVPRVTGARGVVDVHQLARILVELARMPAGERQAMGLRGRQRAAELYSARMMVDRTLAVYRDLLSPGGPPREAAVPEPVSCLSTP
jgi:D-inositol-3-phosphate glycosyltransferase